jgi:hypothetical protein
LAIAGATDLKRNGVTAIERAAEIPAVRVRLGTPHQHGLVDRSGAQAETIDVQLPFVRELLAASLGVVATIMGILRHHDVLPMRALRTS